MKEEVKKSPRANLETHKITSIMMGVVVGLAVLFFAFEWSSQARELDESIIVQDILAEEEIEITHHDATPPPPPPPPPTIEEPEEIEVVDEKVDTRIEIQSEDDASKRQTETYVPPPPPKPKQEEVDMRKKLLGLLEGRLKNVNELKEKIDNKIV